MSSADDAYDNLGRLIRARDYMRDALTEAKQIFASTANPKWDEAETTADDLLCDIDVDPRLQDVIDAMEELAEELEDE